MYVPDNYDAYEQYEAQQEAGLARLPKCDCCGEPIYDDELYDINGELYCEECMNNTFRQFTSNYEE